MMLQLLTAAVAALTSTTPPAGSPPSFLFILGDDIGWADFKYNNGTAATPHVLEWTRTSGTVVMQDFHRSVRRRSRHNLISAGYM